MKIVLTGAGGQLGQQWQMWALSQPDHKLRAYNSAELDITNPESFDSILGNHESPDVWINCAAYTHVDLAESQRDQAMRVNAEAPGSIARWCLEHHCRLVHYSTDYVFSGSQKDQKDYPKGYTEDAFTHPLNAYGESKLAGELAIESTGILDTSNSLLLRVAWLCSPHGRNFVTTMARLATQQSEVRVVDDQTGAPAFCDDIVTQTLALLDAKASGVVHLGSSGQGTWADVADAVFDKARSQGVAHPELTLHRISTTQYPTPAARPYFSKLSTEKFTTLTGLYPPDWRDSLNRCLADSTIWNSQKP